MGDNSIEILRNESINLSDKDNSGIRRDTDCQSCNSSQLETENGYRICTDCGHVNGNDTELTDDPMQALVVSKSQIFGSQPLSNSFRNELANSCTTTPVQKMGLQMAETLALNYSFNTEMKDYLMNYYTKGLNHKNFFKQSLKNKRILAAVCVYITLMNHNESIAIQYVCSSVDCNGFEFGQMFNLFVNTFPECKPIAKPIEELVPSVLADFHINEQEVSVLQNRVIDIISIEKACWLVDGRSPLHLITAATYLGWKSLQPYERAAVDFNEFCNTFGIKYQKTAIHRIKELNDVFVKLGQLIPWPWRQRRVHRNNVAFFIEDIIRYQNSLLFDLKKDVYQGIDRKDNNCGEEDFILMNSFKRNNSCGKYGAQKTKECEIRKTRKTKRETPEDIDISDSEISAYLRNESEIKIIKKLRKRAKRMDKKMN